MPLLLPWADIPAGEEACQHRPPVRSDYRPVTAGPGPARVDLSMPHNLKIRGLAAAPLLASGTDPGISI